MIGRHNWFLNMKHPQAIPEIDLGRLRRFNAWPPSKIDALAGSLSVSAVARDEVLFSEPAPNEARRVLLAGIARVTGRNATNDRVTVDLIAPGLLPEVPSLMMGHSDFRCEAHYNCRVGTLNRKAIDRITSNGHESILGKFLDNDLKHWTRVLRRASGLHTELHERIAITMLDLCDDFGIQDARGVLVTVPISHEDIASMVGASRPRVVEQLGQMERDHLLLRQGERFIVKQKELSISKNAGG
jgi:CRP/FNR family transcriptional regulator, cyclic AMP receptor protein